MSPEIFRKRYFQLPRAEIGHLRFILESYDGLAFARTLDRLNGLVEIAYSTSRCHDAETLLAALAAEVGLREVATPEQIPSI
ncbi:MAG: DUF4911 domain-containing protein [Desulfuromonadales bacterium]